MTNCQKNNKLMPLDKSDKNTELKPLSLVHLKNKHRHHKKKAMTQPKQVGDNALGKKMKRESPIAI